VVVIYAASQGYFDEVPVDEVIEAQTTLLETLRLQHKSVLPLIEEDWIRLSQLFKKCSPKLNPSWKP
jgi:F0F1-type ATP synthase alpha subunit